MSIDVDPLYSWPRNEPANQHFNYMHATVGDVFSYMVERLHMGRRNTHHLRLPDGPPLLDLDQTLYQALRIAPATAHLDIVILLILHPGPPDGFGVFYRDLQGQRQRLDCVNSTAILW